MAVFIPFLEDLISSLKEYFRTQGFVRSLQNVLLRKDCYQKTFDAVDAVDSSVCVVEK